MTVSLELAGNNPAEFVGVDTVASPIINDGGLFYMPPLSDEDRRRHRQRPFQALGFKPFNGNVIKGCLGLESPVDPETLLPLATLPIEPFNTVTPTAFTDFHHHYHAKINYVDSDHLLAVRMSRGQDLPRWLHEHYHNYFSGPKPPIDRQAAFRACLLACAGVVPRKVIDFSSGHGPYVRTSTRSEHDQVLRTIHREGITAKKQDTFQRNRIGFFFANYAIEHAVQDVAPRKKIAEFLYSRCPDKRAKVGNYILRRSVGASLESVRPVYRSLRKEMPEDLPKDPWHIVTDYFTADRLPDYYSTLKTKLRSAA